MDASTAAVIAPDDADLDAVQARRDEIGAIFLRVLPDGQEVAVVRVLFGFRVCIGAYGQDTFNDAYCFEQLPVAIAAASSWTGEGDLPEGWHRHIGSGRRRPGGDPALEHIAD
jgi:hypothetical protein